MATPIDSKRTAQRIENTFFRMVRSATTGKTCASAVGIGTVKRRTKTHKDTDNFLVTVEHER
jgi:predicted DNA-binding ribbon-helix-helix protein